MRWTTALRVFKAATSALLGKSGETNVGVTLVGIPGVGASEDDESGERYEDEDVWGPAGIVSRIKDAAADGFAEFIAAPRPDSDGAMPIGARDKRIAARYPNPKKGTTAMVGYSGAFVAIDPSGSENNGVETDIVTMYVPTEFDSAGKATKAMAVVLDPSTGALQLVHPDGYAISLTNDGITMRGSKDGTSFMTFKEGVFTVDAKSINLQGNVALGANPASAVPLTPGAVSPPGPSVWISPV